MKIAVWGAKGNVGREVVAVCKQRGHSVIAIDADNAKCFLLAPPKSRLHVKHNATCRTTTNATDNAATNTDGANRRSNGNANGSDTANATDKTTHLPKRTSHIISVEKASGMVKTNKADDTANVKDGKYTVHTNNTDSTDYSTAASVTTNTSTANRLTEISRQTEQTTNIGTQRTPKTCAANKFAPQKLRKGLPCPDVAINFSTPQTTHAVARYCAIHRCALIDGVTARNTRQSKVLQRLSERVAVCQSVNFSQGATLLTEIATSVAEKVKWDCEITEIHRKNKQDAPSGTAKHIAAAVLQKSGSFTSVAIHSLRCGNCCGTHTVVFGGDGERLEITHRVENRKVFAIGAVLEAEKTARATTKQKRKLK